MLLDIKSKLLENKYLPLNKIRNKQLHTLLNDKDVEYYVKIIEKCLDYTDKNDEVVFSSSFKFALVAVLDETGLLDSFAYSLKPFFVRTVQDSNAINEIFEELREDFDEEYPIGDA